MTSADIDPWVKTLLGLCALAGVAAGFLKWVWPLFKAFAQDLTSARDSIVGRAAVHDSITGRTVSPELPGIGVRMANQEVQMGELTRAVADLAKSHVRLDDLDGRVRAQNIRLVALEEAAVERVVSRAESAAAWRVVEAVARATPDPEPEPDQN